MKIYQKAKILVATLAVVLVSALTVLPVRAADAFTVSQCPGYNTAQDKSKYNTQAKSLAECFINDTTSKGGLMGTLNLVLNVIFGVVGFVAVIMLVYGGIQYTISSGDAGKVKKAKDTILYGIVGLIISLLAAAIVNFVLTGVFSGN